MDTRFAGGTHSAWGTQPAQEGTLVVEVGTPAAAVVGTLLLPVGTPLPSGRPGGTGAAGAGWGRCLGTAGAGPSCTPRSL